MENKVGYYAAVALVVANLALVLFNDGKKNIGLGKVLGIIPPGGTMATVLDAVQIILLVALAIVLIVVSRQRKG